MFGISTKRGHHEVGEHVALIEKRRRQWCAAYISRGVLHGVVVGVPAALS